MKKTAFLLMATAAIVCWSANVIATDIEFRRDGVIQEGDYYDNVYVYGHTVEMTGGYAGEVYMYDKSTFNMSGGEAGTFEMEADSGSTVNISGGVIAGSSIRVYSGCTFNMSGGRNSGTGEIGCYGGTINISGGEPGVVMNGWGSGTVNITGGDWEDQIYAYDGGVINIYGSNLNFDPNGGRYGDGLLTGFWRDGTPFSLNYFDSESGDFTWQHVVLYEIPGNDECARAIPVRANEAYNGSTLRATGTDVSSCADKDTYDVWHSFTADFDYEYMIRLCGSAFDTTLAVFDECGGTELACNDDAEPGVCPSELQSQLTLSLRKGLTYLIRIAGSKYQTGEYTLTIIGPKCRERPAMDFNEDCKVDFRDFALFMQSWLECNLDPPEVCWQ